MQGRREGVSDRRTWYLKNRRPLAIPDIKANRGAETSSIKTLNIRGYLGAPLFSRSGDLIGVLRALSYYPREFSQEEIDLAEQLARGAATAIENSRLYEDLKKTNTKLREREEIQRFLKELSQDITSMDLKGLLQKLTDRAREFLRADICDIRIREPDATRVMAASGIAPEKLRSKPGRGLGRLRTYTETREPIRVSDLSKDPDPGQFTKGSTVLQLGLRGYLGVPFFASNGQFLGIMRALTYQPRDFSQEEADLLQQLTNGAAIAIENTRLYQDLEKSNRVKTEFLGVMSHELRTPLNVIMGYTTMMLDGILGEIKPEQNDALNKVTRQSKDLLAMVESIMEATKIESESIVVEQHAVNVSHFLADLQSSYQGLFEKNLALTWDYPEDLPVIKTDRFKLARILQNLIGNAIKFTDEGSVTVSARVVERAAQRAESMAQGAQGRQGDKETRKKGGERKAESEEIGALPSAPSALRFVEFRVSDTGIGIGEKNLPIIFDMFRQVDSSDTRLYGGMGLGLYIVKKLTDLLGGTVAVESEPGKGSTFSLRVPLEHPPA
jgi:signal transduction histidine kinase